MQDKESTTIRMYKMMPFESFEKTLKYWALRASEPSNGVIPMENFPQFSGALHKEQCLLNASNSPYVFMSFTTNVESPAMWGLYAERGRGVCLVFDFPKPVRRDASIVASFEDNRTTKGIENEGEFVLRKIKYRNDEKRYKFEDNNAISTAAGQEKLLLNKPNSCSFEEEYRIIKTIIDSSLFTQEGAMFRTPLEFLTAVIVGPLFPRTPEILRAMYKMYKKDFFERNGINNYNSKELLLHVFRAEFDSEKFKFKIEDL